LNKSVLRNFIFFALPFAVCLLVFVSISLLIQSYLAVAGQSILAGKVAEKIDFSPFGEICIARISLPAGTRVFSLENTTLRFAPSGLFKKKLLVKSVFVGRLETTGWPQGLEIFGADSFLGSIRDFIPQKAGGFAVVFNEAAYCFRQIKINDFLFLDTCISLKGDQVKVFGRTDLAKTTLFDLNRLGNDLSRYIDFFADVVVLDNDILLNQIKISHSPYVFNGSGSIRQYAKNPYLDVRFYSDPISLGKISFLESWHPNGGDVGIIGTLTGAVDNPALQGEIVMPLTEFLLDNEGLEISRLLCKFFYGYRDRVLTLRELSGIVDGNLKFFIDGKVAGLSSPLINLRCRLTSMANPGQQQGLGSLKIDLKGRWNHGSLLGDAYVRYPVAQERDYGVLLKNLNLSWQAPEDPEKYQTGVVLQIGGIELAERKGGRGVRILQEFDFSNLTSKIQMTGKRFLIEKSSMEGYGGKVWLRGKGCFKKGLPVYSLTIDFDKIDFKDRKISYPVYCEISGVFSGYLDLEAKAGNRVQGIIVADQFRVSKLAPLDKVADFIGINSIKDVGEAEIAAEFDFLPQHSSIKRFDLDGQGIRIRSNFDINEKNWLDGQIALSMPRKTLEESKIFKKLLSIARERHDSLDFVVRVKGFADSLRTELVESDFRDKLKDKVGTNIQRYIEEEANKAIDEPELK